MLSGRSAIPLNASGRAEADRLARRLAAVPLAAIHASPCRRAEETATAGAAWHTLSGESFDALDEIDFGAWAGQPFATLADDPDWAAWNTARGRATAPGGEGMTQVTARARAHLEKLDGDGPVLCVSHCDVIRGLVCHYLGLEYDRMLGFDCDPASLTTLRIEDGRGHLIALNERAA